MNDNVNANNRKDKSLPRNFIASISIILLACFILATYFFYNDKTTVPENNANLVDPGVLIKDAELHMKKAYELYKCACHGTCSINVSAMTGRNECLRREKVFRELKAEYEETLKTLLKKQQELARMRAAVRLFNEKTQPSSDGSIKTAPGICACS